MKKTIWIKLAIRYIEKLELSNDEWLRLISELESIFNDWLEDLIDNL